MTAPTAEANSATLQALARLLASPPQKSANP